MAKKVDRENYLLFVESIESIIVAHKDRLVRFGFEWFEEFCRKHGTRIIVINHESMSPQEEMTKDLLSDGIIRTVPKNIGKCGNILRYFSVIRT